MFAAFHKPFGVLSQFTPDGSPNRTLAEFGFPPDVYSIGRLDADSEGLLLLSDERYWTSRLMEPGRHVEKTYRVLVERLPSAESLEFLRSGVDLLEKPSRRRGGRSAESRSLRTLPAHVELLDPQPLVPERIPPVRVRKTVRDYWLEIRIVEGKNRQVRRMTAAIGHPALRLIRVAIGTLHIDTLPPGQWRELTDEERNNFAIL